MTSPDDTLVWPLTVEQGEKETYPFPILLGGEAANVANWVIDAKVKTRPGGPLLHAFVATGDDPEVKISDDGTAVELTILPAVSAAWTWTSGWYRIKLQDPGDATNIQRVVEGAFMVNQD